jgi:alkanesulfonate monooxygenase SsuD/methylene tetrahydromethanopterin reductase-like flavin-dependent oxidoreductase (luciferase family)
VVEIADGWHPLGLRPPVRLDPDELAGRARRLAELADRAGRDPADIVIAFKAPFGFRDGAGRDRTPLSGSPAQIVEDLQAYVAAGARHFVLDFTVPTPPEMLEAMERFAADVRPQVRDA